MCARLADEISCRILFAHLRQVFWCKDTAFCGTVQPTKGRVLYILTFSTNSPFCATFKRYFLMLNRLQKLVLAMGEELPVTSNLFI